MEAKPFLFLLLLCTGLQYSSSTGDGYDLTVDRPDDRNQILVHCRRQVDGLVPADVDNPVWYFNGTLHTEHKCTVNAILETNSFQVDLTPECEGYLQCRDSNRMDTSLPLVLLTYPILRHTVVNRNEIIGDSFIIPCGISQSAVGNFVVSWTRLYTVSGIPIIDTFDDSYILTDYSLIVEAQPIDSTYICVVEAVVQAQNHLPSTLENAISTSTQVSVSIYVRPIIQSLTLEEGEDNSVLFVVMATGTNNKYMWTKNEIMADNDAVSVDKSSSVFRLSSPTNGDVIRVRVNNTNVHGEGNEDFARAFVIVPSITIPVTESRASTGPTITVTVCMPSSSGLIDTSEMVNITLMVVIPVVSLILLIVVFVGVVYYCAKQRQHCDIRSGHFKPILSGLPCNSTNNDETDNDEIVIRVGSNSVIIKKSKMNNIREFMRKINTILVILMDKVEDDVDCEGGLAICDHVDQLRDIMRQWVEQPRSPSPQDDNIVTDHSTGHNHGTIACDSPPMSKHNDMHRVGSVDLPSYQDLPYLSNLSYEPQNSINSYYVPEPVAICSRKRSTLPSNDVLDLLLPTLAGQRSSASRY